MRKKRNNYAFSLTEVLLAVGTLSIGMIFVAGVFPVAIHFSTIASERTIAAVVADEAFAKIRLYGEIDPNWVLLLSPDECNDFSDVVALDPDEFAYPSDPCNDILRTRYCWSALCRRVEDTRLVQVTVFVCRKIGSGTMYHGGTEDRPIPVPVGVSSLGDFVLQIEEANKEDWINDGYSIVEDGTGHIYRVTERGADPDHPEVITLDENNPWQGGNLVWVVPPPAGGGRYPCIAVYQKVIGF